MADDGSDTEIALSDDPQLKAIQLEEATAKKDIAANNAQRAQGRGGR